jgi:hypothetical protein
MSTHRGPGITRAEAERLLDTGSGAQAALAALIASAAPPAAVGEMAGEYAALTDFRAARLVTPSSPRRHAMLKTTLANLITAKFAATAAAAAAATGGIALVAATTNLAGPSPAAAHATFDSHATQSTTQISPAETDEPTDDADATDVSSDDQDPPESDSPTDTATPSPSLDGLCKAYQAGAANNPGKALANPAFTVLVAAAGGTDNVAAYCVTLVGPARTHPAGAPTSHPGGPPSSHPSGAPASHPGGAPSSHPSGAGTGATPSHPTGRPASVPVTHPTGAPTDHLGRP